VIQIQIKKQYALTGVSNKSEKRNKGNKNVIHGVSKNHNQHFFWNTGSKLE